MGIEGEEKAELLQKIRERVLEREREKQSEESLYEDLQATIEALESMTSLSREEMEKIIQEVKASLGMGPQWKETEANNRYFAELPATVKESYLKMPETLQLEFMEEYTLNRKSSAMGYLLWIIPPPLSLHYIYVNRFFAQFLFAITGGGFLLWWLIDLLRVSLLVENHNRKLARKIIKKLIKSAFK